MKTRTRRHFLKLSGAAWVGSMAMKGFAEPGGVSESTAHLAADPRRPQFHLLPARNWMNDPNGPIYFAGKYHMFFQYNPAGPLWGNMSWNHAVSDDMLLWKHEPVAFTMTPGGPDAAGCFSGSAILGTHNGKPRVYAIYTGVVKDKEHETIRNEGLRESQCLAWSDDPQLRDWEKRTEAIIPNPPPGMKITGFRDPSVWKQGETYFMVVGSGVEKAGGCVLLYRSRNLTDWEYLHPLAQGRWSGVAASNPVGTGEMWECPDFFALDGRHVLIYSTIGKVFWQSGLFDVATLKFRPEKNGLIDLDAFYAPKTQLDAKGRRILWGWVPERRSQQEMLTAGWSGMMSLPRVLHLDKDGMLRMEMLPEISELRKNPLQPKGSQNEIVQEIPRATGEVVCAADGTSDLRLRISAGDQMLVDLSYLAAIHSWTADGNPVTLPAVDLPKAHVFVDGSVVELVINERISYTKRFYYSGSVAPEVSVHVTRAGARLDAWTLSPISEDRLTSIVSA